MKRSGFKRKPKSSKNKAWDAFSKFIRQREADENGMTSCISCGKIDHWKNFDAGHFVPASISLALRFDERNVHAQCGTCNRWDGGSIHRYTLAMIKKYGHKILEELDEARRKGQGFKIYESDYREMIEKYATRP